MHPTNPNYIIVLNKSANIAESMPVAKWEQFFTNETIAGLALVEKLENMAKFIENQYSKK